MIRKIILTLIAVFIFTTTLSATEEEARDSLISYANMLSKRFDFLEIEKVNLNTMFLKTGDSISIDATLDEEVTFAFVASSDSNAKKIIITAYDKDGAEIKLNTKEISAEYPEVKSEEEITYTPSSVYVFLRPVTTDYYSIKVTLSELLENASEEGAWVACTFGMEILFFE